MKDESWLRDALRAATTAQPQGAARATGALHRARQRRRQRVTAASFATVAAVFVAATLTSGGPGSTGLQPVAPSLSPTLMAPPYPSASPTADSTPSASARGSANLGAPSGEPQPSASQPFVIGMPPEPPGPLDVYFMVDSTADMVTGDAAVRRAIDDIVRRIDDSRSFTRGSFAHGFATFADWGAPTSPTDPVYTRLSPVRVPGGPLPAIDYGGGGDYPEGHTLGLDAAIGVGHLPYTQEGQDARFRVDARRVIVLITNAAMKQGSPYPSKAEVAQRLREQGVSVVALSVTTRMTAAMGRSDLVEMAKATGGVATEAADCDGDGRIDVKRGAAIVCGLVFDAPGHYAGFADLILGLA